MVNQKKFHLTPSGKEALEQELKELLSQRPELAKRVAEAKEFGDLKENSEYDEARTNQGVAEQRIDELQDILSNVAIIKEGASDKISLGSRVEIKSKNATRSYQMVDALEENPSEGRLSQDSPLGSLLIGKKLGDKVSLKLPNGETEYEIIGIE